MFTSSTCKHVNKVGGVHKKFLKTDCFRQEPKNNRSDSPYRDTEYTRVSPDAHSVVCPQPFVKCLVVRESYRIFKKEPQCRARYKQGADARIQKIRHTDDGENWCGE